MAESPRDTLIRTAKADRLWLNLVQSLCKQANSCRPMLEQQPETRELLEIIDQLVRLSA